MGSAGKAAGGILRWIVVLGLVAALLWLVSERNSRTWSLAGEDGRLVVKRGLFLPIGSAELKPTDPAQAKAYAPIVPPPGKTLPEARQFLEEPELDQALYDLLADGARDDIGSGEPARLERGLGYLERAMGLPAISANQRDKLAALRAESGYFEAKRLVERARAELFEAVQKLKAAAAASSPRAVDAEAIQEQLRPAIEATSAALRLAGPTQPVPASAPAKDPAKDADSAKAGQAQK